MKFQVHKWGHRIESARERNQVAGTNIYSFCAIKMQLYQIKHKKYATHSQNFTESQINPENSQKLSKKNEGQPNAKVRELHSNLN